MNILFLTTHVNTGGITSYLLTLGGALVKSGHRVWVASSGGDCETYLQKAGINHVKINVRTKSELHPKLILSLPILKNLVRQENINIIHAQTRVTQVLGTWLGALSGIPLITTCHGFFRPRWFRRLFPCWGRAVIAISHPVAEHLKVEFKVPQNKVHLIVNGIDLDRFVPVDEQRRQIARKKLEFGAIPLIGIIARLSDVKGINILIKAMPFILKDLPLAELLIAGQGPEEINLRSLTKDLGLESHVHFKNTINQPQELLAAFDVFVMPSLMEGLGLSVIEAQACGIPVVASRIGGLVDLIEDGTSGYLVKVGDFETLAGRIVEILRDPQQSKRMAQKARSHIEEHFSSRMMVNKTIQIYEQYTSR